MTTSRPLFSPVACIATFIWMLSSSVCIGQETMHSPEACMKAATDLARAAEEKKLPKPKLEQIDVLVTKIASHCEAEQFTEAIAVAQQAQAIVDGR